MLLNILGKAISNLSMEGRMTICNMSIEAGARAGLIAPDVKTINYIKGRPMLPKKRIGIEQLNSGKIYLQTKMLDMTRKLSSGQILLNHKLPGRTSPQDVTSINGFIPDPEKIKDLNRKNAVKRSLDYMGLKPNQKIKDIKIDRVFVVPVQMEELKILEKLLRLLKTNKW